VISHTSLKADIKLITREPVLMMFMFLPIFLIIVFKLISINMVPIVHRSWGFDFSIYYGFFLSFMLMLTPSMLGTVTGFLMLDDRDNRIYELMSITPLGYSGYITNRFLLPFFGGIIYSVAGHYVMNIFTLSFPNILFISILTGIEGITISLVLFKLAGDKVKGLTFSKALGVFPVLALSDIFNIHWLNILSLFNPFYWIVRLITNFNGFSTVISATLIHIIWLLIIIKIPYKH
jgi:fluoroquinolone transport system permease protein